LGELVLTASETCLTGVYFPTSRHMGGEAWVEDDGKGLAAKILARTREELAAYFARTRTTFDLPLEPSGTPFELRVWEELRAIPFGATRSYSEIARRLGDARLTRAVGAANGKNPIPIIVPCHRVVGANGDLTGYRWGLQIKKKLLAFEQARADRSMTNSPAQPG